MAVNEKPTHYMLVFPGSSDRLVITADVMLNMKYDMRYDCDRVYPVAIYGYGGNTNTVLHVSWPLIAWVRITPWKQEWGSPPETAQDFAADTLQEQTEMAEGLAE